MKFLFSALLLFVLVSITLADTRSRTPARLLAKQTGATQFEEERFETHTDCNEHKHHLKKRSSDEDVDYEVYQGVVGRPGIDFPIYPRIPKTTFSCRSFGNGYFADMDTDCQVFHICEEGRKISFLCPNGTIFQQSELTCDWWFKVNCLGSPGYYAESAEILNKQRVQRVRPSVPVQGFNIVGGGLNIKPKTANSVQQSRPPSTKSERRIDSNEEPSLENVDFDDISGEKQLKGRQNKIISNIDNNSNDNESQITAETASFVAGNKLNSYTYEKSNGDYEPKSDENGRNAGENRRNGSGAHRRGNHERNSPRNSNNNISHQQTTEKARNGHRGHQRFKEEKKTLAESFERNSSEEGKKVVLPEKIVEPTVAVTVKPKTIAEFSISGGSGGKTQSVENHSKRTVEKTQSAAPEFPSGTYSTARRIEATKATPFYTPTIPTVSKSKTTESKGFFIKGKLNTGAGPTTPNPNHFNAGSVSSFILESSATKATTGSAELSGTISSTFRPIVIGMRHNFEANSAVQKAAEYLPTTTTAPTRPTYLPKSSSAPKATVDASGELLLFAPGPSTDDASSAVSRNVNEMLKTINIIKDNLEDVEEVKFQGSAREGLDIPPSSGPDALVSLAKYFATEQNDTKANSVVTSDGEKKDKSRAPASSTILQSSSSAAASLKPSDTTATVTTAATPSISHKSGDIKASLLSEKTVSKYSNLFGLQEAKGRQQTGNISDGLLSHINETADSKLVKEKDNTSPFPQIGSTDATIRQLAEKPESRKIAQVFSNALSTYLENPDTFREQLAAARPTEPSISSKANFEVVTATDSSLFRSGSAATYLPTRPTPAAKGTTTPGNIAAEINNKFDYSTQLPDLSSTTEFFDATTTFRSTHDSAEQKHKLELSAELAPPSPDSGEGEEFLQGQHTQSFVKSRNNFNAPEDNAKKTQKNNAAYVTNEQKVTAPNPTENPWNHVSQTDFLDPLTINDALMRETKTSTISPFTYLPKETTTQLPATSTPGKHLSFSAASQRLEAQRDSSYNADGAVTTERNGRHHSQGTDTWHDIFRSYDIPVETLPSNSGLQRIANKLFGGLNETEAIHLQNVMQQAEHNRQVLSLLLLLIQTCDDQNGRALERSRKHLLNALIDMDSKLQNVKSNSEQHKATGTLTTTTSRVPVTTYRRANEDIATSTTPNTPTTTDLPATTGSSIWHGSSVEETTKFEIRVEDPEEDHAATSTAAPHTNVNTNSDRRALELLKSLYSLASKFQSRR